MKTGVRSKLVRKTFLLTKIQLFKLYIYVYIYIYITTDNHDTVFHVSNHQMVFYNIYTFYIFISLYI